MYRQPHGMRGLCVGSVWNLTYSFFVPNRPQYSILRMVYGTLCTVFWSPIVPNPAICAWCIESYALFFGPQPSSILRFAHGIWNLMHSFLVPNRPQSCDLRMIYGILRKVFWSPIVPNSAICAWCMEPDA